MSKGVVSDLVTFVVNALGDTGVLLSLESDEEERRLYALLPQHVEDLRSPLRIRTIVEGNGHLVGRAAVHVDFVGRRHGLENLVTDQVVGIDLDLALARSWARINAQDFSLALDVDILTGGNSLELGRRVGLVRPVPHRPKRTVLGA